MTQATNTSVRSRQPTQNDDEIDIGFLLGSLWDHKIFIAVLTVILALIGFIYATLATPEYKADALVQIEQKSGTIGGADMSKLLGDQEPRDRKSTRLNSSHVRTSY